MKNGSENSDEKKTESFLREKLNRHEFDQGK